MSCQTRRVMGGAVRAPCARLFRTIGEVGIGTRKLIPEFLPPSSCFSIKNREVAEIVILGRRKD